MIWFKPPTLAYINSLNSNTLAHYLGIEFIDIGSDNLSAKMPIRNIIKQPFGNLHGGASCVLAETLGSIGSSLVIDPNKKFALGLELNANHVKRVTSGHVVGVTHPIHLGKLTHIWDIKINDEFNQLICISRLTVVVMDI